MTTGIEKFQSLKVPVKVFERAKAIKEADRILSGRSTTLIDIVNIGIKHIEDEHRRLRSGMRIAANGHGRNARRAKHHRS